MWQVVRRNKGKDRIYEGLPGANPLITYCLTAIPHIRSKYFQVFMSTTLDKKRVVVYYWVGGIEMQLNCPSCLMEYNFPGEDDEGEMIITPCCICNFPIAILIGKLQSGCPGGG